MKKKVPHSSGYRRDLIRLFPWVRFGCGRELNLTMQGWILLGLVNFGLVLLGWDRLG